MTKELQDAVALIQAWRADDEQLRIPSTDWGWALAKAIDTVLAPVTPQVTSDPTPPCPECACGKHGNCRGDSWNNVTDEAETCPCYKLGHVARPSVEGEGDTAKHVRHRDIHGDRSNDINGPWFCCAYVQLGGIGMNDCNECGEPFPCSAVVSVEGEGPTPGGIPDLTEAEASAYWEALHPSVEGEREATQDEVMAAIPTLYLDKADDAYYIAEALLAGFFITRKETKQ